MLDGVIPNRAAVCRSIVICSTRPCRARSLDTSRNCRTSASRATRRGTQASNRVWSGFSRKNRYWARPTVLSMVRSCTGCMAMRMPASCRVSCCSRRMIAVASSRRWSRGRSEISIRPLFSVALVPSTPMNDDRSTTSRSRRIASASACCLPAIAPNEMSWAAYEMPWIRPVSCTGKKPFGISTYCTQVSPSVSRAMASVSVWCSSTQPSPRS